MSRDPPQRREARFAKRRCPLHPIWPFAGMPGSREAHGATEAARPERSLQARVSRQGWKPARRNSFAGSVHDSPPRQGTPGKAISRRGTERRGRRGRGKRRRTVTGTVTTEK
ncbi:hypothetical protein ACLB1T_00715 [Escherichia coli]